jgi:FixJ family two-component response regulator
MQAEDIRVPTVVMAGRGDFDENEMKQFENVVAYLRKPFEMRDMIDAVKSASAGNASAKAP